MVERKEINGKIFEVVLCGEVPRHENSGVVITKLSPDKKKFVISQYRCVGTTDERKKEVAKKEAERKAKLEKNAEERAKKKAQKEKLKEAKKKEMAQKQKDHLEKLNKIHAEKIKKAEERLQKLKAK